jgi:hypothetical protein
MDVVVARRDGLAEEVWINDGNGGFVQRSVFGAGDSIDVALGDLDGDQDLDAIVTNVLAGAQVFRNDGVGNFSKIGEFGTPAASGNQHLEVSLADPNRDGSLDAVLTPGEVWINNGHGTFKQFQARNQKRN